MPTKAPKLTKRVLLRDIVIPAGTVFVPAPTKTERNGDHIDALVSLSNDCCANFTVYAPDVPDGFLAELKGA